MGGHGGDAHGIADHASRGAAVRDEDGAANAEQRRTPQSLVVETLPDAADAGAHEEVADRTPRRAPELGAQGREDEARQALEELDGHVADRGIADDHIGQVRDEILALDVADETQVAGRDEGRGVLDPLLPLAALLADGQQRDGGLMDAEYLFAEDGAHARVLRQVVSARIGRGPDVEEHEWSLVGDHLHGQRRPIDARQASQAKDGGRHARPRMAGRHDRIGAAFPDEAHADVDARVSLAPHGRRGMLLHLHVLGGVDDLDVGGPPTGQDAVDAGGITDQDEIGVRVAAGPGQTALDDLDRRVVAAHGVDGDPKPALCARVDAAADGRDVHTLPLPTARRRSFPSWP